MEQIMKSLVFLVFTVQLTSADKHSLWNFYTTVTGINFPEFTAVGVVDGVQFVHYDSYTREERPKTEWIKKVVGDDAGYWDTQTQILQGWEGTFKANVATAMERFNQTGGVHTAQVMYGCELDDDGTKRGYSQEGYDGEDFISLDLNTGTWTAANAKAVITKQKWERLGVAAKQKNYLENTCIEWLQKYMSYGRDTLERRVPPEVSLFRKDSSSPVVCHATGFYPKAVMISWQKNGEDLYEDIELRETLPNQDGTFQKKIILTVSPEELDRNQYTCVVQHAGLEKEIRLQGINCRVLTDVLGKWPVGIIVGVVIGAAGLLLALIVGIGLILWKKKRGMKEERKSDYQPVQSSSSSDSGSDQSLPIISSSTSEK